MINDFKNRNTKKCYIVAVMKGDNGGSKWDVVNEEVLGNSIEEEN